jgi:ACT domain-containing protein
MAQPTRYALSVMCEDKVGLVARLTEAVLVLGGNIEVLHQGVLQGYFVFMMLVSFDREVPAGQVEKAIESAGEAGQFVVSILPRKPQATLPPATGAVFILTLTGRDAPGILKRMTGYLADHRINIEGLTSEAREGRFLATARLTIPEAVDIRSARLDLAEVLKGAEVQVVLMHEDIFAATSRIEMPGGRG